MMNADDAGRAKKSAGVRLRDKSLANAQRKDQRRRQKVLIEHLDDLLPPDAKRLATTNGAGVRAIGLSGRSLHNVLHDVVDHLHALRRREAAHTQRGARRLGRPSAMWSDATSAGRTAAGSGLWGDERCEGVRGCA